MSHSPGTYHIVMSSSVLCKYNYLELEIGPAVHFDSSDSCVAYALYVCKSAKLPFRLCESEESTWF